MNSLQVFAIIAFATVFVGAQECQMNQPGFFQKMAMECATHDIGFMMQIGEIAQSTDDKQKMNFVCDHVPQLADLTMCMIKKVSSCVPAAVQPVMKALPDKQRIIDALNYMCEDKTVIMNQCMSTNMMPLMQCYQQQVATVVAGAAGSSDVTQLMCKAIHAEEKCFKIHQGTCSDEYVNRITGAMDKLFPASVCGANTNTQTKDDITNKILGNLLIHGQPIGGGSLQYKPYNVVNV